MYTDTQCNACLSLSISLCLMPLSLSRSLSLSLSRLDAARPRACCKVKNGKKLISGGGKKGGRVDEGECGWVGVGEGVVGVLGSVYGV